MSSAARPLENISVVSIATNVPGPVAAARLTQLGATVTKVEPPSGDLVARVAPDYYAELTAGQEVVTLDLKTEEGGVALEALLSVADVFITSHRPSALARLGLGWDAVHSRHPRLCHVAIVGDPGPGAEVPGHDLTYQAVNGLIFADDGTPRMPSTLIADLAGQSAPQRRPWPHCSPGSGPARAATARSPCLWRLSRWQIRCGTASPRPVGSSAARCPATRSMPPRTATSPVPRWSHTSSPGSRSCSRRAPGRARRRLQHQDRRRVGRLGTRA